MPETMIGLVRSPHVRPDRPGLVLDTGCGRGTSSLVKAEHLWWQRVVGLEAASAVLVPARE
ncbi:hypothetical protein [Streptomyces diastaticus]|uniref:hypothetical protein n=1 Tax=Streptomyces diastaticus TaxID=1956 RepID=UPI0033FCA9FA